MTTQHARGTFDIEMTPAPAELGGRVARHEFAKTWSGDLTGTGRGVMLSSGDPAGGDAGYVCIETVDGTLEGVTGGFCLQQFGQMLTNMPVLQYEIVNGSGTGGLAGIAGILSLTVDDEQHIYDLEYELDPIS